MKITRILLRGSLAFGLALAACGPIDGTIPPIRIDPSATIAPVPSETPVPSPSPSATLAPSPTPTQTPTPTPVYHTVSGDDDMFGISLRYGVSLEALKTANPSVIPNAMGEGISLLIPITPTAGPTPTAEVEAAETPEPVAKSLPVDCFLEAGGGLWCFAQALAVEKPQENVSAIVSVYDADGALLSEQTALLPLNIQPANTEMPLLAYFSGPIPDGFSAIAAPEMSLPVPEDDRYLPVTVQGLDAEKAEDGRSVRLSGEIAFSSANAKPSYLWLAAWAVDADGRIVAARRWESADPAAGTQDFLLSLYSMDTPIESWFVIPEAGNSQP